MKVMGSTTITLWLVLLGIAFVAVVLATTAQYLGINTPFVSDFFQLIGLGGGASTARNVAADHVVPAWKETRGSSYGPPPQG